MILAKTIGIICVTIGVAVLLFFAWQLSWATGAVFTIGVGAALWLFNSGGNETG